MKGIYKTLFFISMAGSSANLLADCRDNTCTGKIAQFASKLTVSEQHTTVNLLRSIDLRYLKCDLTDDFGVVLPVDAPHREAMYSLLLTAFAANATVALEFNPAAKQCELTRVAFIPAT